jgi:hypothetical protein
MSVSDRHVFKSRKVRGCCYCREDIAVGSSCHTEQEWIGPGRFKVRYYHPGCWVQEVLRFSRPPCSDCDLTARFVRDTIVLG